MTQHAAPGADVCIISFDSAWTDNAKAPGAICAISVGPDGATSFTAPRLVRFLQAHDFIETMRRTCDICLVALDQPTLVPNAHGCRPVERVASSLVSFVGGGVQPANRSKRDMFGDDAPIWRFLDRLGAEENPERARIAQTGLFIVEVFPALALPSLEPRFCERLAGPRYNPERRKTFRQEHWHAVVETVTSYADRHAMPGMTCWAEELRAKTTSQRPTGADQDCLDAVLCALIGYHWRCKPRDASIMIGDLTSGYMIAPVAPPARFRLEAAARKVGVAVDGATPVSE